MPFYEYECQACKFYLEVMQKITDKPLTKCPSCGKKTLKKLVSAPVFRLKGAGWYETDFKTDKESKRNLAGTEKDEAKPEAKAEGQDRGQDRGQGRPSPRARKPRSPSPRKPRASGPAVRAAAPRRAPVRATARAKPKKAKTRRKARR